MVGPGLLSSLPSGLPSPVVGGAVEEVSLSKEAGGSLAVALAGGGFSNAFAAALQGTCGKAPVDAPSNFAKMLAAKLGQHPN